MSHYTLCYLHIRLVVNITVNKIYIWNSRHLFPLGLVTTIRAHNALHDQLWWHQQSKNKASETQSQPVKVILWIHVRSKITYELSWQTFYTHTWRLFWGLFPSLLCTMGNKHQNNLLMNAQIIHHSSTYIILYLCMIATRVNPKCGIFPETSSPFANID